MQTEIPADMAPCDFPVAVRPGRSSGWSDRRRLLRALRKAHRALGVDRKHLGLGGLTLGAILSLGIAVPAHAQDAVCVDPLTGDPVPAQVADTAAAAGDQVVCGSGATATGENAIALGVNASASDESATAIGRDAVAFAKESIAIGRSVTASGIGGVAIGVNTMSGITGLNVAIGADSSANGATPNEGAVAIGTNQHAEGDGAVAIGAANTATGDGSVAIGRASNATGPGSLAMGDSVDAQGNRAVALGSTSSAGADSAVAIGNGASADIGGSSVAIGRLATAGGFSAIAMGESAQALQDGSIAIGDSTDATQIGAIALGTNAGAGGENSTALGSEAQASGYQSFASGYTATATGGNSVAVGTAAQALDSGATAIGANTVAGGADSLALGSFASASASDSVAIGRGAVASDESSIALGAGSQTAADIGTFQVTILGTDYSFAGTTPIGTVSVGAAGVERTITNVAAGRVTPASTDAINGSQLAATNQALEAVGQIAAAGWNLGDVNGNTVNIGPNGAVTFEGDGNISVTQTGVDDDGRFVIALNPDVDLTAAGSLRIGSALLNANGFSIAGGPGVLATGIDAGNLAIVNVGPGVNGTDAVNLNQLNAVAVAANTGWNISAQGANASNVGTASATGTGVDLNNGDGNIIVSKTAGSNDVTFDLADNIALDSVTTGNTTVDTNGVSVAGGPNGTVTLTGAGLDNGGNRVTGVAAGVDSTDAVNVSQLGAAIGNVNIGFGGNSGGTVTRSSGQVLAIQGEGTTAGAYSGANIRTVTDPGTGAINIQLAAAPRFGTVTINDGGSGKITGVTAATLSSTSTEAVNGSQLVALGDSMAAALGSGSTYDPATNRITTQIVIGSNVYSSVQDALQAVNANAGGGGGGGGGAWNLTTGAVGTGVVTGTSVTQVPSGAAATFTAGNNIMINQNGGEVQVAVNPNLTGIESIAITGGPTINGNGIDMGGDRITNVGTAVAATDAINLGQLNAGLAGTLSQANQYTDMALADLRFDLRRERSDANGGTAAAMAMSQVPQAFEPGMGIAGVGMSTWQGEQAVAFGFSKASDDGRVVLKATGSYNTRNQGGAAVGVGFQF